MCVSVCVCVDEDNEVYATDPFYQCMYPTADVSRVSSLPPDLALALPQLKSAADLKLHYLLSKYLNGQVRWWARGRFTGSPFDLPLCYCVPARVRTWFDCSTKTLVLTLWPSLLSNGANSCERKL